jgi:diketogulonate reductase-like aldo/keto reductase
MAMEVVELADGNKLPLLGLGVWQVKDGKVCEDAVRWALELGYRHIDTAQAYRNEASVGRALKDSGVARDEVFITTKFNPGIPFSPGKDPAAELEKSLRRLGLDQVDLYLVHWPRRGPLWAWPGMERALERGLAKSIGVSNYSAAEVDAVVAAGGAVPVVDQVQFSAVEYRRGLLSACQGHNVVLEAYSPLGTGKHLRNGTVAEIAERVGRTPRRCCSAGACSTACRSSPSQRTASGSPRTRGSSTSPGRKRTWPRSTRSTGPAAPASPARSAGGVSSTGVRVAPR